MSAHSRSNQATFTTIDGAVDYYKSLGFIDMGLITGTRTMRRGYDPSTAVYVAIWEERPAHVVAERF